ncbi:transposase family protein [Halorubellus sp. PRR65]|uniref:transposase family protein n=1 Tax=Halorubellus sp. PRR65 TaxID=3098148 RepID=UPI002B262F59|nr:transposase family protein [Halorubellus sp. PRR65]
MSPRPRFDRDYHQTELHQIATHLQTDVDAYLIGGGAMSIRDLKTTTKDIDLVVANHDAFSRLMGTLSDLGYEEATDLGADYDKLGARHCVRNDEGCQFDVFQHQIANKLVFSDGMQTRSDPFITADTLTVGLVSREDIFLFKSVAGRPDDIEDMATLVQTNLDFDTIEHEIQTQLELLGGERFVTFISQSLEQLDEQEGIQTPLDDAVRDRHRRYMEALELRLALEETTSKPVSTLATEIGISETEVERRFEYLTQFGFAERTDSGIRDTGKRDDFEES